LQEDHDLLDLLLLLPGDLQAVDAHRAHAGDFHQAFRAFFDHLQRLQAKMIDDTAGGHRADAFDQPTAEILAHAFDGGRKLDGVGTHVKLAAVFGVSLPKSAQPHRLAHHHARENTDHRGFVTLAFGDEPRDGVAIFFVLVGEAFDYPFQGLEGNVAGG